MFGKAGPSWREILNALTKGRDGGGMAGMVHGELLSSECEVMLQREISFHNTEFIS
jgi:hypothetical protein